MGTNPQNRYRVIWLMINGVYISTLYVNKTIIHIESKKRCLAD